jgi:hypothetical protein
MWGAYRLYCASLFTRVLEIWDMDHSKAFSTPPGTPVVLSSFFAKKLDNSES